MKNRKSKYGFNIVLYILFFLLIVFVISCKKDYHKDELSSYLLANHYYDPGDMRGFRPESGKVYAPPESIYMDFFTVDKEHKFDYANVWRNQAADVHPPLYYVLVHTICSFFPGKFNMWFAGVINLIFSLLSLWIMRKLIYELLHDEKLVDLCSLCFVTSPAILSANTFFRMYIMAMFEVTLVTYIFLHMGLREKRTWKFYISIIIVSVAGTLTHYYFDVWLFFLCVIFFFYLLHGRKFKDLILFAASMAVSAVIAILIFPSMIYHMFGGGYRGDEAIANLTSVSMGDIAHRLSSYYTTINQSFFGGMLTHIIICALFIGAGFYLYRNDDIFKIQSSIWNDKEVYLKGLYLIVPIIAYFLLVCKMVPYLAERYVVPTFAVLIIIEFCVVYYIVKYCTAAYSRRVILVCIIMAVMWSGAWQRCQWSSLYRDSASALHIYDEYASDNCIYIYESPTRAKASFLEVRNFRSISFYTTDEIGLTEQSEYYNDSDLVVFVESESNPRKVIESIVESYPNIDTFEQISEGETLVSYHAHKK